MTGDPVLDVHAASHGSVRLKRAYDDPAPDDGYRVLVDRLWPRGRSKERLRLDDWARDLGPSTQLRTWFGHDPARWEEFRRRYRAELADPERAHALDALADRARAVRSRSSTGRATRSTTRRG